MKKVRKVLFYIDMMGHGGAQRVMWVLMHRFLQYGVQVILVNDFELANGQAQYSVSDKISRLYLRKSLHGNPILKNIERVYNLRNIVKTESPDVVVSFLGRPNERMLISTMGLPCKKIVSVRNDPIREYGDHFFSKWLARFLFLLADGCVFQTHDARKYFLSKTRQESAIIKNPVSAIFFNVKQNKAVSNIISVGRLEKQKNNTLLIRAFSKIAAKYSDVNLVFYGSGSLKKDLQLLVHKLDLDTRVDFAGDTDDVPSKLKECKIFVLSSDFEGMPNALMEAMAAGVPCIATDCPCGGPKEIIENGKDGILVSVGNEESLAHALDYLLSNTRARLLIGKNAKEKAKEFTEEQVVSKWYQYFENVLNR